MNEQAREGDLEATGSCLLVSIRVECRRAVLISRFPCLQQVGDRMPSHAAVQGQRVLIEPEKFTSALLCCGGAVALPTPTP